MANPKTVSCMDCGMLVKVTWLSWLLVKLGLSRTDFYCQRCLRQWGRVFCRCWCKIHYDFRYISGGCTVPRYCRVCTVPVECGETLQRVGDAARNAEEVV